MSDLRIAVYDSASELYQRAFRTFLSHTDQKAKARDWLDRAVDSLPHRGTFIDAGAGNSAVTAWFAEKFDRVIAMEPNPFLRTELAAACPGAEILEGSIMDAELSEMADFVLCSHVFYYIDAEHWRAHLERLGSYLRQRGRLIIVLQNPGTDCMDMLQHFCDVRFDLRPAVQDFSTNSSGRYLVRTETVPCGIVTEDLADAVTIAEFMLNLVPLKAPPLRSAVEEYVANRFCANGSYSFTCSQDFYEISRVE